MPRGSRWAAMCPKSRIERMNFAAPTTLSHVHPGFGNDRGRAAVGFHLGRTPTLEEPARAFVNGLRVAPVFFVEFQHVSEVRPVEIGSRLISPRGSLPKVGSASAYDKSSCVERPDAGLCISPK